MTRQTARELWERYHAPVFLTLDGEDLSMHCVAFDEEAGYADLLVPIGEPDANGRYTDFELDEARIGLASKRHYGKVIVQYPEPEPA